MAKNIKITLKKSLIGRTPKQRRTVESLGLRKINQSVIHTDTPAMRQKIEKVKYLLKVEELEA